MIYIQAECKVVELKRNILSIPAYEILCPFCKSRQLFEIEIADSCSGLFCSYCKQRLK